MIVDRNEFQKFYDILPELERDELYFLSLSARNKYLDSDERINYGLGRTEMFTREVCRDKEGLYYVMEKLKASLNYRKTNTGCWIPEKALVTYMNINPSSSVKAFMLFQKEMNEELSQIYNCLTNGKEANYEAFKRVNQKLMNAIQRARSRKIFIDIDCDCDSYSTVQIITDPLRDFRVLHCVITTKSGWHVLIKKDTLSPECKLHEHVQEANKQCKEVMFNKNEMIPVPGTLQGGHLVRIV